MWEHFWLSFASWLRMYWPYAVGFGLVCGLLLYAIWTNWREERRKLQALELELTPKLAKYDALFRRNKRRKTGSP